MEPLTLALIFGTFFFAAFLKGTAGLGFATTCLGIMAAYLDMRLAIPLVVVPSLLSNGLVMFEAGGFIRIFRRFWVMYAAAIPGLILGLWILGDGATTLPRMVLGASMFLYGGWGLWGGSLRLTQSPALDTAMGLLTGTVNGLTGSQIMPIMPYLMSLDITKDELVQAINTSFTLASLVMLAGLGRLGLLSTEILIVSAVGIVPVGLGIFIGSRVRKKLPEAVFRKIVLGMISLLGLVLLLKSCL
ncbi:MULTISPECIES: sulfite exporter TauE/SafE family protein [unclassified Pseudodesulfovibrio]|uniref:sulfite exporter TauE/SafE family protein n=1 Tax=unclassified Pseudodesulfovibrio TaxID=2661612 RepID=UPI000FEBA543|nr:MULTISPECIES: sulfite exporter TauE/SafE family protein [unclassified Pseudodesulfovibrio]MCJ2165863.1 sulfite exporter TauE/SafE family protein [Pseudodesulfovibrio sp. S3-i]RWU02704.1 sulfite exporter TauE/SafE family protein [Pseudodesulfovibrio sp. S3]